MEPGPPTTSYSLLQPCTAFSSIALFPLINTLLQQVGPAPNYRHQLLQQFPFCRMLQPHAFTWFGMVRVLGFSYFGLVRITRPPSGPIPTNPDQSAPAKGYPPGGSQFPHHSAPIKGNKPSTLPQTAGRQLPRVTGSYRELPRAKKKFPCPLILKRLESP